MRDLQADLEEFNHWMSDNYDTYDPTLMWFSRVLPEATTRAIKAEDRVDTLQIVAKENYRMYENTLAENAHLREELESFYYPRTTLLKDLAEIDKAKEAE